MIYLLLVLFVIVPYVLGTALTIIFGERNARGPLRWVVGILSTFACFFMCLLIELRMDGSLDDLCRIFSIVLVSFTAGSVPVVIFGFVKKRVRIQNIDEGIAVWFVPAFVIGLISMFLFEKSYVNDITIETVQTTLYTGKIYEYSSLLGIKMEAGLPIFNKIEIVPMFYACLCRLFNVDIFTITKIIAPCATYVANLAIMWELSAYLVREKHRNIFMIFHLLVLLSGTYLPTVAIPTTVGYPLLVQGFTGYAWGYAVLVPAMVLVLFQKRYVLAGLFVVPFLGLIKMDRIFFTFRDFFTTYHSVNTAGKLFALYLVAVVFWVLRRRKKKMPVWAFLSGSALICATLIEAYELVGAKKRFVVYAGIIILACCSFAPYKGQKTVFNEEKYDFNQIKGNTGEATIWAPDNVMDKVRRENPALFPIYGRDEYNSMLLGTNYEPYSEDVKFLEYAMSILQVYSDEYVESLLCPGLETNGALNEVDIVMIPLSSVSEKINMTFVKRGFSYCQEYNNYLIMRRYD